MRCGMAFCRMHSAVLLLSQQQAKAGAQERHGSSASLQEMSLGMLLQLLHLFAWPSCDLSCMLHGISILTVHTC